jgi:hypothetical protein
MLIHSETPDRTTFPRRHWALVDRTIKQNIANRNEGNWEFLRGYEGKKEEA